MQTSKPISPIRKAWYRWKSLRLPWRKRFLVGLDLQGNTFWEFRDSISLDTTHRRMRRIARYPSATPYSDIHISPQWHQWLRHTRRDAPSLVEQAMDVRRVEELKVLAREADERWAAKGSLLHASEGGARRLIVGGGDDGGGVDVRGLEAENVNGIEKRGDKDHGGKDGADDPWKRARGAPGEEWQPQAWDGRVIEIRR